MAFRLNIIKTNLNRLKSTRAFLSTQLCMCETIIGILIYSDITPMIQVMPLFSVDITVGEDADEHEISIYVRVCEADTLNDVVRHFEGVSFCPVAEGAIPESSVDFYFPQDRLQFCQYLRDQLLR